MPRPSARLAILALACSLLACPASADAPQPGTIRVATFNVAMYRQRAGQLREELEAGESTQAKRIAEVLQRVRPHVVLLNEFDYEPGPGQLPDAFRKLYLEKPQAGLEPIRFPWLVYEPVNTGVDSGLDLDHDGKRHGPADGWGYGAYPGQYGMLLLSRLPVGEVLTYRKLSWRLHVTDPIWPMHPSGEHYYSEVERRVLRLPSKSFWDVAVRLPGDRSTEGRRSLHLVCSHPTPPVFDGPEDRNGCRNFDEIRLIAEYLTNQGRKNYPLDSGEGHAGLVANRPFVVLGDLNADPVDGSGRPGAIRQLLEHPAIDASFVPTSKGAVESSANRTDLNSTHRGDPAHDTADFSGDGVANLRVDYVLPSKGLEILGGGVFWPTMNEPGSEAARASDHRLVWIDIKLPIDGDR